MHAAPKHLKPWNPFSPQARRRSAAGGSLAAALPAARSPALPLHPAQALRRIDGWLGFSRTTRRSWAQRLPAVGAASLALTAYAWSAGFEPPDLRWALGLGLAAALLGLHCDSQES